MSSQIIKIWTANTAQSKRQSKDTEIDRHRVREKKMEAAAAEM